MWRMWETFLTQQTLRQHMNIHRGKYNCTECGRCCQSSQHLTIHRRSHSGEKPFECVECDKRFAYQTGLFKHMNIHPRKDTEEKPYSCPQCEERFSRHSALSYHMNIHRHWPKYKCTACGKCFGDRADMAEHRQNNLGGNCLKVMFLIRDHSYARRSQWHVSFKPMDENWHEYYPVLNPWTNLDAVYHYIRPCKMCKIWFTWIHLLPLCARVKSAFGCGILLPYPFLRSAICHIFGPI